MTIAAIEPTGVASSRKTTTGNDAIMGKNDFLNLLVAQLKHQDPLNPLEGTEFTAQLAQFTSLEQLNNINSNLESLQDYQAAIKDAQAIDLIGKTIEAPGNTMMTKEGRPAGFAFDLTQDAAYVAVNIYGPEGNFVRTIETGPMLAGRHSQVWDGKNQQGSILPGGSYTYEVLATAPSGDAVTATPYISARVTGVNFDGKVPLVLAGDHRISFNDVRQVTEDVSALATETETDGLLP